MGLCKRWDPFTYTFVSVCGFKFKYEGDRCITVYDY